jgi:hypothetical protein
MVAEVEQQRSAGPNTSTEASAAAAAAAAAGREAAVGSAAAAGPMLSVVSLQGSKVKITHRNICELTLSAYHIDTELLFTTQPFSSLSATAAAAAAATGGDAQHSSTGSGLMRSSSDKNSGLGKVTFVQPSARVVLQLPLQPGTAGAAAASAGESKPSTASWAASSAAAGSAAECCVLDLDVLTPQLVSQSVLLEVAGGGVTRTLPR